MSNINFDTLNQFDRLRVTRIAFARDRFYWLAGLTYVLILGAIPRDQVVERIDVRPYQEASQTSCSVSCVRSTYITW